MKSNTTVFETVVVTTADVLGTLASFQWGKAAQGLFSFKHELQLIVDLNKKLYLGPPTFPQIKEIQEIRNERREINPKLLKDA